MSVALDQPAQIDDPFSESVLSAVQRGQPSLYFFVYSRIQIIFFESTLLYLCTDFLRL